MSIDSNHGRNWHKIRKVRKVRYIDRKVRLNHDRKQNRGLRHGGREHRRLGRIRYKAQRGAHGRIHGRILKLRITEYYITSVNF